MKCKQKQKPFSIIINMYMNIFEFEKKIKRKDNIRDIMITSKLLDVDVINNILEYL